MIPSVTRFLRKKIMDFDTATHEEMNGFMDHLASVSPVIIAERQRIDSVELMCEQLELDKKIEFSDERAV